MPLPEKHPGEDRRAFIDRCMSNKLMKAEYPKVVTRLGVCFSQARKGAKRGKSNTD